MENVEHNSWFFNSVIDTIVIICRTEIFGKAKTFFIYNEKLSLTRQSSSGHCLRQLDGKDHVPLPTEKFTIDMCVVDLLFLILIIILFEFRSWRDVLDSDLWRAGRFLCVLGVSSTNKTDSHDIAEILLKVALNTIILPPFYTITLVIS
jgi:hypothetical protein